MAIPLPRILLALPLLASLAALPAAAAAAVDTVVVLGLFKDKAVLEIDGRRRLLSAGQTSPEGVTLVSADAHAAVLEIDGRRATYELGTRINAEYAAPAEQPSVHIWPTERGMYTVTGSINGFPVRFVVDTGATYLAMNRGEAKRLGIDYLVEGEPGVAQTASGRIDTYRVVLDRVRVGDILLRNVPAAVLDGEHPAEVLLGMSFLNRVDMRREGDAIVLQLKY